MGRPLLCVPLLILLSILTFTPLITSRALPLAPPAPPTHNWAGANSFFLFALNQTDRLAHLAALQAASMRVVRIFLSAVGDRAKGSSSTATPDLEPDTVGVFDDSILLRIDQLMLEASQHSIKLDISMHDRYALGCWSEDAYYRKYQFPSGYPGCNAQKNDVRQFYQNATIEAEFDRRLLHIVQHRNALMGNRTWGHLHEAVLTFAAQNEAQSFIPSRDWDWACRRAKLLRPHLHPHVLLSTNGATVDDSLQLPLFQCPHLNLMAVHNYGGGETVAANYTKVARALAEHYGKRVYVEEFGAQGDNATKAAGLAEQVDGMWEGGHVPWMFWELVKTEPRTEDYEVWLDAEAWTVLSNRSRRAAEDTQGAFAWPELFGNGTGGVGGDGGGGRVRKGRKARGM